jgi:hypothetical protein
MPGQRQEAHVSLRTASSNPVLALVFGETYMSRAAKELAGDRNVVIVSPTVIQRRVDGSGR